MPRFEQDKSHHVWFGADSLEHFQTARDKTISANERVSKGKETKKKDRNPRHT